MVNADPKQLTVKTHAYDND